MTKGINMISTDLNRKRSENLTVSCHLFSDESPGKLREKERNLNQIYKKKKSDDWMDAQLDGWRSNPPTFWTVQSEMFSSFPHY